MKRGVPVVRISKDQKRVIIGGHSMLLHEGKHLAEELLGKIQYIEIWPKERRKK